MKKIIIYSVFLFSVTACGSSSSGGMSGAALPLIAGSLLAGSNVAGCPAEWPFQEGAYLADASLDPEIRGDAFGDPLKATNGICGGGYSGGSTDVYSTGNSIRCETGESCIVLQWNGYDIENATGIDFVVYENPFAYGSGSSRFMEAVIVEVSNDATSWCGWNPEYSGTTDSGNTNFLSDIRNPAEYTDFAGIEPVYFNQKPVSGNQSVASDLFAETTDENGTHLIGGGDGFDLDAPSFGSTGTSCTPTLRDSMKANGFRYIRLTGAYSRNSTLYPLPPDSFDRKSDIDGVVARSVKAR